LAQAEWHVSSITDSYKRIQYFCICRGGGGSRSNCGTLLYTELILWWFDAVIHSGLAFALTAAHWLKVVSLEAYELIKAIVIFIAISVKN